VLVFAVAITLIKRRSIVAMEQQQQQSSPPWVLVTGSAKRIGRAIAEQLFSRGCNLFLHAASSVKEAQEQANIFNSQRANSAKVICADLSRSQSVQYLIDKVLTNSEHRLMLVNNASQFFATPIGSLRESEWQTLWHIHVTASSRITEQLAASGRLSSVVNLLDIYSDAGLAQHSAYIAAKATLQDRTREWARRFAPNIRVNAVSPGAILWPEQAVNDEQKAQIIAQSCLQRMGAPENIATAVAFLLLDATYVTGQNLRIDGGRRLYL